MADDDDDKTRKSSMESPYSMAVTIYDYIDNDGDLLSLDILNEECLAFSILRRGQDRLLTVVFDSTEDVRRLIDKMTEWADAMDEVQNSE